MSGMLEGKVAIVTGGANGIGRASVKLMAQEGADVAVWEIDEPRLKSIADEVRSLGRKARTERIDITNWVEVEAAFGRALSEYGKIDIMACIAGGSGATSRYLKRDERTGAYVYPEEGMRQLWTEQLTEADWDGTLDMNLKAVFLCCKAAIPTMKKQHRGAIVAFSSIGAFVGMPHGAFAYAAYAASKAGVNGLVRHLARELAQFGIRANCVSPGWVGNERMETRRQAFGKMLEEMKARGEAVPQISASVHPMARPSTIEEQAQAVIFLASDRASYINGVTIDVNGGAYMR